MSKFKLSGRRNSADWIQWRGVADEEGVSIFGIPCYFPS